MVFMQISKVTRCLIHPTWHSTPGSTPSHLYTLIWSEVNWSESRSVVSNSLWPPWTTQYMEFFRLEYCSGIFPTQGSNPGLPHCRQILCQLSHKRSPRILEWVAYPFSSGSSQPRDRTGVSCIAGRFFTNWAIWNCQLDLFWLAEGQLRQVQLKV